MMGSSQHTNLVLFDGVCNLCNGFVKFLIRQDKKKLLTFGSLQRDEVSQLLSNIHDNSETTPLSTVIYIREGQYYSHSTAILNILRDLGGWWRCTAILRLIPRPIRDLIYNWVSRNRYRCWGKRQDCMIPTPELKSRFPFEQ